MGKYSPLRDFLARQGKEIVPMSFGEIERVLGESLPASKQYPAWWSNNPGNNVMTKEWIAAGYQTESVDIAGEKLVFRKVRRTGLAGSGKPPVSPVAGLGETAQTDIRTESKKRGYSIFGCMKGMLTLRPDIDLTAPDDEIADWIDRKYGRK